MNDTYLKSKLEFFVSKEEHYPLEKEREEIHKHNNKLKDIK